MKKSSSKLIGMGLFTAIAASLCSLLDNFEKRRKKQEYCVYQDNDTYAFFATTQI